MNHKVGGPAGFGLALFRGRLALRPKYSITWAEAKDDNQFLPEASAPGRNWFPR